MTEDIQILANIVGELNDQWINEVGMQLFPSIITLTTDGDSQTVLFAGWPIWDSEQDERRYIPIRAGSQGPQGATEEIEDMRDYLVRRLNTLFGHMGRVRLQ